MNNARPLPCWARAAPAGAATQKAKRTLTWAERRELDGIEARIEAAEERVAVLDAALADPTVWGGGGGRGIELRAAREQAKSELDGLFARWEELMTLASAD